MASFVTASILRKENSKIRASGAFASSAGEGSVPG
jgi:hypothetical protein